MNEVNPWKKLDSKKVYESKWLALREDKVIRPDKKEGIYNVVEIGPSVYVVAVNDAGEICLVGQWRYPTDCYSWEVPGGSADGEDLLTAAKRELWEETGLEAQKWVEVGSFQEVSGIADGIGHIFVAKYLKQTSEDKKIEDGINNIKWVKMLSLLTMVKQGEIIDAMTMAVLAKVFVRFGGRI